MNPKKLVGVVALCGAMTLSAAAIANAGQGGNAPTTPQASEPRTPAPPPPPPVQLKVTVVISRFQGEKKVSNLPYTFMIPTGDRQSLRMGAQVPIQTTAGAVGTINYQNVGLNIDCSAQLVRGVEGRYMLSLTVSDSQVNTGASSTPPIPTPSGAPIIQNFTTTSNVMMRDGQTAQITTATDKVTGEVVKVDATLEVVK